MCMNEFTERPCVCVCVGVNPLRQLASVSALTALCSDCLASFSLVFRGLNIKSLSLSAVPFTSQMDFYCLKTAFYFKPIDANWSFS